MNFRWYISTLIIILTLLGVVDQQQISVPNQEIVLQFTNSEVSSDDAQITIAKVTEQLENLGADNIHVSIEEEKGKLTISYYSNIDVAGIKKSLSKNGELAINSPDENSKNSESPIDEKHNDYDIDVYEIQKDSDSGWNLNGTYVAELKPEGNRFSNPDVYAFIEEINIKELNEKVAYMAYYNVKFTLDKTSYKIPEVRAGPLA